MKDERFLVTGAMGCIGAWVVRQLVREGVATAVFDLATEPTRMRLLLSDEEIGRVRFMQGDMTDLAAVQTAVAESGATHVIHLAGLQVPFCRANPALGAAVNVVGTVNILQAVREAGAQVRGLAYASSLAALGPDSYYAERPIRDDVRLRPDTLYGVYKMANEHTARLYWQDWGVGSVGLRPYIVYGVARDQGMTSDMAKAILAVAAERPYHIKFGGMVALQYTADTAAMFIAAARASYQGAAVCNLRNDVVSVAEFVDTLKAIAPEATVTYEAGNLLPFPADLDDSGLRAILGDVPHTSLQTAVAETLAQFKALVAAGKVDLGQLG
ncbi:MAG: NAD(P)-dependent oxidoreductase [Ardenticatenaceae bacterium]|nr:NAD(P)-dependent oxidoreductase [Ardenticatenaceae bacterium]